MVFKAEWDYRRQGGTRPGAELLADYVGKPDLDYEPDPSGRHRMKFLYYLAYRLIRLLLRAWSRPGEWLDRRFWIKVESWGCGLGAHIAMRLMELEFTALRFLEERQRGMHLDCTHTEADRQAAARFCCVLCARRDAARLSRFASYLVRKEETYTREWRDMHDALTRLGGAPPPSSRQPPP
ncbi:MAG: hypothetical protein HY553_14630 [Elusimicrobia bacterium]|nr:hypothetical protein [Elusimicrobiota bacterium]